MSQNIDWPGLLKWSLLYHDTTQGSTSDVSAMTEEERQWLQNAFDSAILDEMKRIKVLLHVLTLPEDPRALYVMSYHSKGAIAALEKKRTLRTLLEMRQEDETRKAQGLPTIAHEEVNVSEQVAIPDKAMPEPTEAELRSLNNKVKDEKLDALDELNDRVLKKDNSVGFVIYNGLAVLFKLLSTTNDLEIAQAAWQLLAVVVKHNPKAQDGACKEHLIQLALSYLYVEGHSTVPSSTTTTSTVSSSAAAGMTTSPFSVAVASSFTPIPKQKFYPRAQIASSAGFSVIRSALYFLSSLLEGHKSSQLVFLANSGIRKVLALFSLKNLPEDRYVAVRRRCLGVLLTLVDDSNYVMINEQIKNALATYHDLSSNVSEGDMVTLERQEELETSHKDENKKGETQNADNKKEGEAPETTTPTFTSSSASKGELVEVPQPAATTSSTAVGSDVPVVTAGEHPAWKSDEMHVHNDATDTIALNGFVAELVASSVDVDALVVMIGCEDTIGREDVLKLLIRLCELAPQYKTRLNVNKTLASALVKRVGAITALCKQDPSEKSRHIEELSLIAKANTVLLK